MSYRRNRYDSDDYNDRSPPKRRRSNHRVSESEDDYGSDDDDHSSVAGGFYNQSDFLRKFGGYDREDEDPDDDEDEEVDQYQGKYRRQSDGEESDHNEEDESEEEDQSETPKNTVSKPKVDFSNLPILDNNGLRFLPKMQYFSKETDCPLTPFNKLDQEALSVIIHLPNGGFHCVAIPLDAVEKDENDKYRVVREKVFMISEVLEEAKVNASASGLGLEGFQKLIRSSTPKKRDPELSDDDDDDKPKPPSTAGFSQSKKRPKRDYESKTRAIRHVLAEDLDDMSIEGQLARAQKIKEVAKKKKYTVPEHEAQFLQNLFLPPIHKWDPAYKPAVTSLPIPHNSWVDGPPELNDYMIPGLRHAPRSGWSTEPQTRWDHLLVDWQRTTVHMASGLTPWLALELPSDPSKITAEMLEKWKKQQQLARLAATGCNILYEELGLKRRMNFYFEFKKSCEWKNLGFLKTVRMGKEILRKSVSKAFNEVKATSKAHDKKMSLITNKNFNVLQASKPWASTDDVASFARNRDGQGPSRGRGQRYRDQGRQGNDNNPRNDQFNSGGKDYGGQGSNFRGRGQNNRQQPPNRSQQQNSGNRNFNNPNNGNFSGRGNNNQGSNMGYQQKSRPPTKNFRGGGN